MNGPELTTVPPDWEGFDEQGRGWYFHLREGFYFRGRGEEVTLAVKCTRREPIPARLTRLLFKRGLPETDYRIITVPPNEWASAVAAVSKRGDVQSAWREALDSHEKGSDADA